MGLMDVLSLLPLHVRWIFFLIYSFSQTTYIKLLFFSSLQEVVDIATLTGACMVALGKDITGWDLHHFSGSDDTR